MSRARHTWLAVLAWLAMSGWLAVSSARADTEVIALPIYRKLPAPELEDWIDPATGTTTRAAYGCGGVVVETTLSGDRTRNYATVSVLNDTDAAIDLGGMVLAARFSDGAAIELADLRPLEIQLKPGRSVPIDYRLGEKAMLEDQHTIEIMVRLISREPGEECRLTTRFTRDPARSQSSESYTVYDSLALSFGVGIRMAESGGQAELRGGSRMSAQLDVSGFLSLSHGISATLLFDMFGSGAVDEITEREIGPDPSVSNTAFLVGYIGRIHVAPWLTAAYSASTGPYVFMVTEDSDQPTRLSTAVFVLRQRVRLTAHIPLGGEWLGVAASLGQLVVPYGELGAIELSGQTLTAMLELMITN